MATTVYDEDQLSRLAQDLWNRYGANRNRAVIFALEGELGAGKTTFTKKLARAAGITDTITSPTFILHDEYDCFDHIDAWRMEDSQELARLGLSKMITNRHAIVIEWADKVKEIIEFQKSQATVIWIKFGHTTNEKERSVSYEVAGH